MTPTATVNSTGAGAGSRLDLRFDVWSHAWRRPARGTREMMITLVQWDAWDFDGGDRWTDWQSLSREVVGKVQRGPGAYVLGLPGGRCPLGRLLQADSQGLLDVGESADLAKRLGDLLRCISAEGQRGHMAGWRLGSGGFLARLQLDPSDFRVSWCSAKTKDEAYRIEGTVLRWYYGLFGELPPLNYKFNWAAWEDET